MAMTLSQLQGVRGNATPLQLLMPLLMSIYTHPTILRSMELGDILFWGGGFTTFSS